MNIRNLRNLIGTLALTLNVCLAQAQQKTFTIAVLPDTQMYTEEEGERNRTLFESQTRWIVDNYRKENIVYVVHVGDIVNRGDDRQRNLSRRRCGNAAHDPDH